MAICVQRHANVGKQATLLNGFDVSPLKWCVCGCGFNRFVHEGMNHISNVEVHLKTRSGNVNIIASKPNAHSVITIASKPKFHSVIIIASKTRVHSVIIIVSKPRAHSIITDS